MPLVEIQAFPLPCNDGAIAEQVWLKRPLQMEKHRFPLFKFNDVIVVDGKWHHHHSVKKM
eukprot:m.82916 g.82916  ORF g.82916 m.82916 type:complete len:60 (+) comp8680_c2_seq1:2388-2567(+)